MCCYNGKSYNISLIVERVQHMGEMKFKQKPREEQAEADEISAAERAW